MQYHWQNLLPAVLQGQTKAIARCISLLENEVPGYTTFLQSLPISHTPVIGITGPPGAGKSTLTDALIGQLVNAGKKVAVLCVDPSSPFNLGAVLGDRIRMSSWYNNSQVYIRSLATRGSMGGLHPSILEITDVLKVARFDYVVVETVGVGQSEIEITGLADVTVVVLVPEAGDDIQTMKAGLMEIANIFVVNKFDRPQAKKFVQYLQLMLAPVYQKQNVPIVPTIAHMGQGVAELLAAIQQHLQAPKNATKKHWLLTEKAYKLIQQHKMKTVDKQALFTAISTQQNLHLYSFIQSYL
ncbi:MAG: methylmalonyl Co-A mutase-associated GTPase MeaB [Bacteroidetes bacterium]|nr:MAG: methylmalonyl Co-A mutase-associated GTPase MeaB [Bacteroidota bacterium]TAE70977.1 MAG: methylmalonyl Co-A mutase-associated GTPase MeaB [Bacteroidota bacterium]TAF93324.1 MAG: methylmalonyl Co-A mutase-associated GTPase MeaB [Bacteroidota bacterium]